LCGLSHSRAELCLVSDYRSWNDFLPKAFFCLNQTECLSGIAIEAAGNGICYVTGSFHDGS
jgi:hypothetical protein